MLRTGSPGNIFKAHNPIGPKLAFGSQHMSGNHTTQHKVNLPASEELLPDVAQVAMTERVDPYSGGIGGIANTVGGVANAAWLVNDIGLPAVVAGGAGVAGVAVKGMKVAGAVSAADRLKNTSDNITKGFNSRFTEKTISSLKSGDLIAGVTEKAVNPFYKMTQSLNNATGLLTGFSNKAAAKSTIASSKATSFLSSLSNVPAEVSEALHHFVSTPLGNAPALEAAGSNLQEVMDVHSGVISGADNKLIKKVQKLHEKAHIHAQKSLNWRELASGQHNTFENVKNASVQQGISGGLLSVASVASVIGTTTETLSDVKVFRQIVADLTGKNESDVNSGDALFADLPHAGLMARRALISSAAPRAVLEGINTVFNIKMIKGSHIGILTMLAPMMMSQGIGMLTSGNILDVYKQMKRNEASGEENLPDQYASLIGLSDKNIYQRGGAGSNFAQELGRIYAERHASVKEVLQAVVSGEIDKEVQAIIAHNAAGAKAQKGAEPAPSVAAPTVTSAPVAASVVADANVTNHDVPSSQLTDVLDVQANAAVSKAQSIAEQILAETDGKSQPSFAERVAAPSPHSHEHPVRH